MRSWSLCPILSILWLVSSLPVCLSFCLFFPVHSSFPPPCFCVQANHLIKKAQPLLLKEPPMETEVLDEIVLQPQNQKQSHDQNKKPGLEDMDTCMVGKHKTTQTLLLQSLHISLYKMGFEQYRQTIDRAVW